MKRWNDHSTWEEAEKEWDQGAAHAQKVRPLKRLSVLPQIPGIVPETARHLKWKSFKYLVAHDSKGEIRRHFLKHPFRYGWRYLKSVFKKKSYIRDGDFFLYGIESLDSFEKALQENEALIIVGFSYCQKPFECPSGRFTDQRIKDPQHLVCRQCDIGKVLNALPQDKAIPLLIPTIHDIGKHVFEIVHAHPKKKILFLITACELTLEMFGDFGNMVQICGVGIRLDGRICNTMRAFELSEKGIKPGLTVLTPPTQERLLKILRHMREGVSS